MRRLHKRRNVEPTFAVGTASAFTLLVTAILSFAVLSPPQALAATTICPIGSGAGQCAAPWGIAVDASAKRLYVANRGNNRIDVFDTDTGAFIKAFGFGVRTGADTFQVCESICQPGIADGDAQPGQFEHATGIAVDNDPGSPSFHDIYVGEMGHNEQHPRVQRLDPFAGSEEKGVEFVLMLGSGVDKTAPGNICTAASGHICGAAVKSEAEGGFSQAVSTGSGVLPDVASDGSLYVVDSIGLGGEAVKVRLQRFEASGAALSPQRILFESTTGAAQGFAVAPVSGSLWVLNGSSLHKFDADGNQTDLIPLGQVATAVEAGPGDRVFIGQGASGIYRLVEIDASGGTAVPSKAFGYGLATHEFRGLALSPSSNATFASESFGSGSVLRVDFPDPGPEIYPEPCKASPLGNSKGTLRARINPEGKPTKYHFELVTDDEFLAEGFNSATRVPAQAPDDPAISSQPGQSFPLFELEPAALQVELTPDTQYHCRAVAENADGESTGPEGEFKSLPPMQIGSTWSSTVGTDDATLNAEINPLGLSATAYFQYVNEATYQKDIAELGVGHGFDHALKAPDIDAGEEPLDLGAGESFKATSAPIEGLVPGTRYRYRIVGTNPNIDPKEVFGPTAFLRAHRVGEGTLPDDRAYELVSPADKASAEVGVRVVAGGLYLPEKMPRIQVAATSGEAITYTSWTSFGEPQSAPAASQYLSKRTAGGWQTENLSPFGFLRNPLEPPYRGFAPDLETAAFVVDDPVLTEDAQKGIRNIYLRDNATGQIRALTVEEPDFTPTNSVDLDRFCLSYGGASADGKHAFFTANGAMAGAPAGIGFSLYEWSEAGGLQLVSVLPSEEPAKPAVRSGFGAGRSLCSIAQHIVANAVSEDGSTVFWTYGGKYSGAEEPLFARLNGTQTVQLDAKVPGAAGPSGRGLFWAATPNGSRAFFTAPGRLTKDAGAAGHIYLYDFDNPEEERLTDLTPGAVSPQVSGVIGASDDGSYLYFVAQGVLTGEEEGPSGQKAQAGEQNLYSWHEGEGLRFIARLSSFDGAAWAEAPERRNAQVAANGDLAFLTVESQALSGYDNRIFPGSSCVPIYGSDEFELTSSACPQAYLYDAEEDTLTCASCNPSGARPQGPTELPSWTNAFEGPHYLSEDGSKLFFESRDALSAADENGKRDVYEFEREGSGSCDSASPSFSPTSGGCVFLVSSGDSEDNNFLIDASADGRDVFLASRRQLVGWDDNGNYDVYDAREGGGFPEPPPPPPACEGESCKGPASSPAASGPSPGTASFQGPGNQSTPVRSRCPKGKVRRRGRCKPRKPAAHRKAKHKRAAHHNGRGRR